MGPRFDLCGDIGQGDSTSQALALFLAHNPGPVRLIVNSGGGDALEGAALMAEVERHGTVTVYVQGIAASAATLPVVAAQEVIMHPSAVLMIHEPATLGGGTADELRTVAETLDKLAGTYAAAYAKHTGHPVSRVAAWMKAETWLTAQEAVELRFADRIEALPGPKPVAAVDFKKFRHAPADLVRLAMESGWAAVPPDDVREKT